MENTRIIKCFIASPGDTLQERELCDKVMREINTTLGSTLGFRLETRKWEKDVHPSIGTDGQAVINGQIGLDYDIFIGIMYKRFGDPTPRAGSGTEEEFDRALALHKEHPEVEIMFYFNREATDLDQIDYEQFGKVNAFREKVRKAGCLTWDYKGPETFEECLRQHLLMRLTEICKPEPESKKNVTCTIGQFLSEQLEERRKKHPSFRLMEIDKKLFPEGTTELHGIEAISSTNQKMPVGSIVAESWRKPKNHLMIEGEGGIGKTVTLLSLPDRFAPHPVPTVYVQLHELKESNNKEFLEEYIRSRVFQDDEERYQQFIHLTKEPWDNGPRILLLLDGFNEIAHDRRHAVGKDINRWAEKPGIQIITSSRYDIRTYVPIDDDYGRIHLQPLERKTIKDYLIRLGIPLPQRGQWNVLDYPLMLTLYAQTEKVLEKMNHTEAQDFKKSNGAGAIIWNYLQRELWRFRDQPEEVVACVLAAEFLAPCMAWQMLHHSQFFLDEDTFLDYFDKAYAIIPSLNRTQFPSHIQKVRRRNAVDLPKDDVLLRFLENELNLFVKNGDSYSLMHQQFRDALAALHLINVSYYSSDLPDEWKYPVDTYVMEFASELSTRKEADRLWELNRTSMKSNDNATLNMLELQKRKRNYDFSELNFSNLNLTHISLFPYRLPGLLTLRLPHDRNKTKELSISRDSFFPQGHSKSISVVAITPNGRCISGSFDRTLRIWDLDTGLCYYSLMGHKGRITTLAVTNDNKCISGSKDKTLRIWDLTSGQCLFSLAGHNDTISSVAIINKGKCISGSYDKTIRIWDINNGVCILPPLEGHQGPVTALSCFSSFIGDKCISGSFDKTLRIWDLSTGECILPPLRGHEGTINSIAITPDGKKCISGSNDNTLIVWDIETGKCLHHLKDHHGSINTVTISPDGKKCISASYDKTLRIWDIETGERLGICSGHKQSVNTIAITPDGNICVSGSDDNTLAVWDLTTYKLLQRLIMHKKAIRTITITPDGGKCICGSDDNSLSVWDIKAGQLLNTFEGYDKAVSSLAASPSIDGKCVCGFNSGALRVLDIISMKLLDTIFIGHKASINTIEITKDGKRCVSGSGDRKLRVWDINSGHCIHILNGHQHSVSVLAITPDGSKCVSGSVDSTMRIWDIVSGTCLDTLEGHKRQITAIVITINGEKCVSGSRDNTICVTSLADRRCLHTLNNHDGTVYSIAISPDGEQCVSGSYDNRVCIWDIENGECLRTLKGHTGSVRTVAYTPDGKKCISGAHDSTLRVWDLSTYDSITLANNPTSPIIKIEITKNGKRCVSKSVNGTVSIWDLYSNKCIATFEGFIGKYNPMVLTPDGKCISGSREGIISIIDVNSDEPENQTIEVLPLSLNGVNFSDSKIPDGLKETLRQNGAIA